MDDNDPITQFFPGEEDVDLYAVLSLTKETGTPDAIKKAYRKLALVHHPDKQRADASDEEKENASKKFQQIGFAYAVLSDEKRKARYDATGKTDEGFDLGAGEDGWEAYFEELFDRVTRGKLDEDKQAYQGSPEEVNDLKAAYLDCDGALDNIMTHIPHSTYEDEDRFIGIISSLIKKGELKSTAAWRSSSKDEKAKKARKKESEKEAKEAEERAKELGVWDEFYGDGKPGKRKAKGKAAKGGDDAKDESLGALQALILKKKEKNMDGFFDGLAAKYGAAESKSSKGKGKKRAADDMEEELSPKKKSRSAAQPPDIPEEEFQKLQQKIMKTKDKAAVDPPSQTKKGRGRKAKQ